MPTFDIVTIFPAMIEQPLAAGILGRAVASGLLDVKVRDLRDFTTDRHRVVDDVPYGGGPGMVLKPDPIFRALDAIEAERGAPLTVVLTSPQGRRFTQGEAQRLSGSSHLVLLCGRYEGFDDRVRERVSDEVSIGDYVLTGGELPALVILDAVARFVPGVVGDEQSVVEDSFSRGLLDFPQFTRPAAIGDLRVPDVLLCGRYEGFDDRVRERVSDEVSIGDYVLTGGELPALVILDAVARFVPGVVGDEQSVVEDSFSRGLLDFPQFTRPAAIGDLRVPDVLLSGNHAEIRRWRKRAALVRTLERRPDLLTDASLDEEEQEILKELRHGRD